jgi:hypothetical protein
MAGFLTNEMTESSVHQQCPSTNHKPGKRTNLKTGYKKKQPIDSIDTKFSKKARMPLTILSLYI